MGLVALVLLLGIAHCSPFVYQADFPMYTGAVRPADLLGPFNGRVVDDGTDKPIKGALVYASWTFVRGMGFVVPAGCKTWSGRTDKNGRYRVPVLSSLPSGLTTAIARFGVVVYRQGYVAYRSDRIFPGDARRQNFVQVDNRVRLARWNPDQSHLAHARFIGGDGLLAQAAAWEHQAAVAQIEGRPVTRPGTAPRARPGAKLLDVTSLLDDDDIEQSTGFQGSFTVERLKDVPRSASYDSQHYRAEGKGQRHDVAFRVWKLGPRAEKHYQKLLGAYPSVKPEDKLGSRSFRASNKDIVALVWLVRGPGLVVSVTCGRTLCAKPGSLAKLAGMIHDRLDQLNNATPSRRPVLPGLRVNPFRPVRPTGPVLK